jgi:hypothetical protein
MTIQQRRRFIMRLSAPKKIVFWISLIIVLLGLLGILITIPFVSDYTVWFVLVGYLLLAAGNVLKGF